MERKFAVTKVVGNREEVLKVFDDDKQAALAYGAEVAKTNTEGVITCVKAPFADNGKMAVTGVNIEVFEVWDS